MLRLRLFASTIVLVLTPLIASGQGPQVPASPPAVATPTQADLDRLEARIFELAARLAVAEQELGMEKAKRATCDTEALRTKATTLRASVRALLGLPNTATASGPSPPTPSSGGEKAPPKD